MKAKNPLGSEAVYLHDRTVDCLARVLEKTKHPEQIQALWDGFASVLYDCDMSRIFHHMKQSKQANQNTVDREIKEAKLEFDGFAEKWLKIVADEKDRHQQALSKLIDDQEKALKELCAKIRTLESVESGTPFEILEAHTASV